jgi:hypothetical protein
VENGPFVPYVDYLEVEEWLLFEDKELTTAEISTRFLTMLRQWAGVFEHSSRFFDVSICRFLLLLFSLKGCLCTFPVYLGCASLHFLMICLLIYQKKKWQRN